MLTCCDIVSGLMDLGLRRGDGVMVHSSLSSLGEVQGGADTVIDALLEVVGPEGTVVVPTFGCIAPFDRRRSATTLGVVADTLWRRSGAVRSLHPTHSVAAIGNGARDLIQGHESASTACGDGTPYHKLAMAGGKILLLGVDLDANTTLHCAELLAGAPYLTDVSACYIADDGAMTTIPVRGVGNSHRDFTVLGSLFEDRGVMRVGRIGRAVCRLLDGKGMLEAAAQAITRNPAIALCSNPTCHECAVNRGKVKSAQAGKESFTLAAVAGEISPEPGCLLDAIRREGVSALEVTAREYRRLGVLLAENRVRVVGIRGSIGDHESLELAALLDVPLVSPATTREEMERAAAASGDVEVLIENCRASSAVLASAYSTGTGLPKLAMNPGEFASMGERPLQDILLTSVIRSNVARLYISDATTDGRRTLPGEGNGQVKEILSALRCRGFDGAVVLRSGLHNTRAFPRVAECFWAMLGSM